MAVQTPEGREQEALDQGHDCHSIRRRPAIRVAIAIRLVEDAVGNDDHQRQRGAGRVVAEAP